MNKKPANQDRIQPPPEITVGDLMRKLQAFPQDAELYFEGMRFYRLKQRAADLVQMEFQPTDVDPERRS